jgi:hypothetical protein
MGVATLDDHAEGDRLLLSGADIMKTKLSAALAAAWGAFACIAVLGAPSTARADTIYSVNYHYWGSRDYSNTVTGTIVTDGALACLNACSRWLS